VRWRLAEQRYSSGCSSRLTAARRWLEETGPLKWLLVLENVDRSTLRFIREHFPCKNKQGNIVFTTRTDDIAAALACSAGRRQEIIELGLLDLQDAVYLLLTESETDGIESDPSDTSKAEDVAKYVGCLPLGISHAAAYMKQSRRHMDDMLLLLESRYKMHVRFEIMAPCIHSHLLFTAQMLSWDNDLSNYEEKSVTAVFTAQLDGLDSECPDAMNLLKVLSYLDPECIPLNMLTRGADPMSLSQSERLVAFIQSPVELHGAIMQLHNRSLVKHQRGIDASVLRIHNLTNMIVQDKARRRGDGRQWFEFAAGLACGAFQLVEDPKSYNCWVDCEMFLPHFQPLTRQNEIYGDENLSIMTANMGIAGYLRSCGRYSEAESLYKKILATREEKLSGTLIHTFHHEQPRPRLCRSNIRIVQHEMLVI
jgi:hypothetical protein